MLKTIMHLQIIQYTDVMQTPFFVFALHEFHYKSPKTFVQLCIYAQKKSSQQGQE
jgi:hypothetical protein